MLLRPHPEFERLRRVVSRSRFTRPFATSAYRSTTPRYANSRDLLSGDGTRIHGGRWNASGSFAAVYASLEPETAVAEALAHFRRAGIPESAAMPRVLVALDLRLSRVLDLTPGESRRSLCLSRRRIQEERWWEIQDQGCEAITQAVGRAAYEAGLEGVLAPSAAAIRGANVVVFPQRLAPGSRIRVLPDRAAAPL